MTNPLIQIVPALPPLANGVGDYALAVAHVMRSEIGVDSCFVVAGEHWRGAQRIEGFAVRRLEERSARGLWRELAGAQAETGSKQVLVQLSGYGYSRWGSPGWLLQGMRQWKAANGGARWATMFHELYASAPPWRATYWAGVVQKRLMAGFARHSDHVMTSIECYRAGLGGFDRSKVGKIATLAVPSNVGEPPAPDALQGREPKMVVFGHPNSRRHSYRTQLPALQNACAALGIHEVYDVGPELKEIPERIGSTPVRKLGWMESGELSMLLTRVQVGFVAYPRTYLAKSGVFAAYCAHRVLPVIPISSPDEPPCRDGLQSGVHYLAMGAGAAGNGDAQHSQRIADAAWNWYQGHSLRSHARLFAGVVQGRHA